MEKNTRRIIGWILSALPLLFLLSGAIPKFMPGATANAAKLMPAFFPPWVFGIVILIAITLYLIPKTQVIGFALATGYYGGAAALAWQLFGGFMSALPCFAALVLLWIGQAMLRPSMLKAAKE